MLDENLNDEEKEISTRLIVPENEPASSAGQQQYDTQTHELLASIRNEMASTRRLMAVRERLAAEEREEQTKRDELAADWMAAARVLDRLFFIIFVATMLIGAALILVVFKARSQSKG